MMKRFTARFDYIAMVVGVSLLFGLGSLQGSQDKLVGVYYSNWFSFPTNWTNTGGCVWAEPDLGWYESANPAVIDQHTEWLTDAGVDFVIMDWSNNCGNIDGDRSRNGNLWAIEDNSLAFANRQVWRKANNLSYLEYTIFLGGCGNDANFSNDFFLTKGNQIKALYLDDPARGDLYFHLHGKPFLGIWGPEHLTPQVSHPDFHIQKIGSGLGAHNTQYNRSTYWSWEEYITPGYSMHNGQPEAMTVQAALRGTGSAPGVIAEYPDGLAGWLNDGTVFGNATVPRNNGETFRDQLSQAIAADVRIIVVQSFNEWTGCPSNPGEEMDPERSNDIEPMKGGHGDLYIQILKEYVQIFKESDGGEPLEDMLAYDFADGTMQGWSQSSSDAQERLRFFAVPPSVNSPQATPHSGNHLIGLQIPGFGGDPFFFQDSSHDTLVLRSPEFLLNGAGSLSAWLSGGGQGAPSLAGASDVLPTGTSSGGFLGVALRDATTGTYVLSASRTANSDQWERIFLTSFQLAALPQDHRYTLDLIDARHGGWGWVSMDSVLIPGALLDDPLPPPATPPTISAIADQTINVNTSTGAIGLTLGSDRVDPSQLLLSGSSSNTALVPAANLVFGGSGTSRTVTVTPNADQAGTATITLTVSDGELSSETLFLVTVEMPGEPGLQLTYAFAGGTLEGWAEAGSDGQGRQFFALVPPSVSSPNLTPHSGDHFVGLHIPGFDLAVGYTQDSAHDTLVMRSPEFTLNASGDLRVRLSGGGSAGVSLAGINVASLPTTSSTGGFLGVALRNVTTGTYVLSGSKSSGGNEWEQVSFTAAQLAGLPQGDVYTLDLIDARHGGWGWVNMDSVTLPGALVEDSVAPALPRLTIQGWGESQVRLSWPSAAIGWTLQSSAEPGGDYSDAGLQVTVENDENAAYDAVISARRFYRLMEP